jgi:hypothetical protein
MFRRAIRITAGLTIAGLIGVSCRPQDGLVVVNNSSPKYRSAEYAALEHLYDIDVTQISLFSKDSGQIYDRVMAFDKNDNLYILDAYECKITVFDSYGRFIKEFGRPGQGPGEFVLPYTILIKNERLYVFHGQLGGAYKVLDLDGRYLSSHNGIIENQLKIKPVGKKEIFRTVYAPGLRGPSYDFVWPSWLWISPDGTFFFPEDNFREYSIVRYDQEGKPNLKFGRPYDREPYSKEAKERFYSLHGGQAQKGELAFPPAPPVVVNMFQDQKDNLWVVSGETFEDNLDQDFKNAVDLFNDRGEWLSSFKSKFVSKGCLYHHGRIYRVLPINTEAFNQSIEVYGIKYLK